jgi:hypothetical protein
MTMEIYTSETTAGSDGSALPSWSSIGRSVVELHREMRNDVHTFRGAGRPRDQLLVLWDWTGCRATAACSSKSASESTM